jgi:hypothetical protein
MPDITMCKGRDCPLKNNCYRYTATPDELAQSYFSGPPVKSTLMIDEQEKSLGVITFACAYFWNNIEEKNERTTN